MDCKGESVTLLADTDPNMPSSGSSAPLDWSPDGSQIAFIAKDPKTIRSVDVESGEIRTLSSQAIGGSDNYCRELCWSSDGTILISNQPPHSGHETEIFALDPNTRKATQITQHSGQPYYQVSPASSPNGQRIAVVRQDTPGADLPRNIFLMNRDGSGMTPVTNSPDNRHEAPAWFPDGNEIAYSVQVGKNHSIYVIATDGGQPTRLTEGDWDDLHPDVCDLRRRPDDADTP